MKRAFLSAPALLLLAGCPADPDPAPELPDTLAWAADEPGPFGVGYATWEITYDSPTGRTRTIPIHVWYPTEDEAGEGVTYETLFADPDSWLNATPAAPVHAGGYPVFAYSHGNQGFGGSSAFQMRHAASHGWVAVAPDHIGNTLITHESPRAMPLWIDRSFDVAAALDALDGEVEALAGPADVSAVVLSGHSFGGHTVWISAGATFDAASIQAMCDADEFATDTCTGEALDAYAAGGRDDRVIAGIPMAGKAGVDWVGEDGLNAVDIPMMQISGTEDAGAVAGVWEERTDDVDISWVEVAGGCHQTFALGTPCDLPAEDGFTMVNAYGFAFARHHLLGDETARTVGLLDGTIPFDDRVTLHRR